MEAKILNKTSKNLTPITTPQGQIPLAAAKDKLFPSCFAKVSKRGTPVYGLVISSLLITLLLAANYRAGLVSAFTFAILLATMAILLVYFLTAMAKLMLLIKAPEKFPARVWFNTDFHRPFNRNNLAQPNSTQFMKQ